MKMMPAHVPPLFVVVDEQFDVPLGPGVQVTVICRLQDSTCALFLSEDYRLTSVLGRYGGGRTLSTISRLPGEETAIRSMVSLRSQNGTASGSMKLCRTCEGCRLEAIR